VLHRILPLLPVGVSSFEVEDHLRYAVLYTAKDARPTLYESIASAVLPDHLQPVINKAHRLLLGPVMGAAVHSLSVSGTKADLCLLLCSLPPSEYTSVFNAVNGCLCQGAIWARFPSLWNAGVARLPRPSVSDKLPEDIWPVIAEFLDVKSRVRCWSVSRSWGQRFTQQAAWEHFHPGVALSRELSPVHPEPSHAQPVWLPTMVEEYGHMLNRISDLDLTGINVQNKQLLSRLFHPDLRSLSLGYQNNDNMLWVARNIPQRCLKLKSLDINCAFLLPESATDHSEEPAPVNGTRDPLEPSGLVKRASANRIFRVLRYHGCQLESLTIRASKGQNADLKPLRWSDLTGTVVPSLKRLVVQAHARGGLPMADIFTAFPNLEHLEMWYRKEDSLLIDLQTAPRLRSLVIHESSIADIDGVPSTLQELRLINCDTGSVNGLAPAATGLKKLEIRQREKRLLMSSIPDLPALEELSLHVLRIDRDESRLSDVVKAATGLRRLSLCSVEMNSEDMEGVVGALLHSGQPLESLDLSTTRVTTEQASRLLSSPSIAEHLTSLRMVECESLSDAIIPDVVSLKGLRSVALWNKEHMGTNDVQQMLTESLRPGSVIECCVFRTPHRVVSTSSTGKRSLEEVYGGNAPSSRRRRGRRV
jgi:hypothetical protein